MPGSSISSKYIAILEAFANPKKNQDSGSARSKVQNRAPVISKATTFKPSMSPITLLQENREIATRFAQGRHFHFGRDVVGNQVFPWLRY